MLSQLRLNRMFTKKFTQLNFFCKPSCTAALGTCVHSLRSGHGACPLTRCAAKAERRSAFASGQALSHWG
jgi:hypothetical protein